jgi:hypothetical protein
VAAAGDPLSIDPQIRRRNRPGGGGVGVIGEGQGAARTSNRWLSAEAMLSGGMARGCTVRRRWSASESTGGGERSPVRESVCSAEGGWARRAYLFAGAGGADVDVCGAAKAMHTRVL